MLRKIRIAALLALFAALALLVSFAAHQRDTGSRGNPLGALSPHRESLRGRVDERLRAGSYTYLRVVDAAGASRWIVTVGRGALLGGEASVTIFGARDDFHSARLGRTFDHLDFAWVSPR